MRRHSNSHYHPGIPRASALALAFTILFASLSTSSALAQGKVPPARNVIFFIGDGMGPAAVTGGRIFKGGSAAHLAMDDLPVTGLSRTYSSDSFVTDSAAGATALACGVKTYNGSIGMTDPHYDPTGQSRKLQSLFELARTQGKSLGVITTARVTDATPACFYATVERRGEESEIADQIAPSGLSLVLGGGRKFLHAKTWNDPELQTRGGRKTGDTVAGLTGAGWKSIESKSELEALDPTAKNLHVVGLFAFDSMRFDLERTTSTEPSLTAMTQFAIKMLGQNPKGYFLMVEGGLIDHGGHENSPIHIFGDVVAMDDAIASARAQAPADTLIVVTADHETGGVGLNGYAPRETMRGAALLGADQKGHNSRPIVSFGTGPGTTSTLNTRLRYKAAYPTSGSGVHTAVDVEVFAGGPGSAAFTGVMDNNEIAWKIAHAMGTDFSAAANIENHHAHLKTPHGD